MPYQGKAALVTGASSGIGAAFARALAARGMDVLVTALPAERDQLCDLATDLVGRYHIRAEIVTLDLAQRDGARRLQSSADSRHFEPDMLVNCAGTGVVGALADVPLEKLLLTLDVNVAALVALTRLYLPRMTSRGHGAIINVASTTAFMPVPYFAAYAASKAFVLNFSEALWAEERRHGVRVLAVCPGPVATRFHERMAAAAPRYQLTADAVVSTALCALDDGTPTVVQRVPGLGFIFAALAAPVAPRRIRLLIAERLARAFFRQG